jgi:hypothetical protein
MLKRIGALIFLLSLVCTTEACNSGNKIKAQITVAASMNGNTTTLCVKGSGYTPSGPTKLSMIMPPYTVGGSPGPNPLVNAPFGLSTAFPDGTYQQILSLGGGGVCEVSAKQKAPDDPLIILLDETNGGVGAVAIPAGFMCGSQQMVSPPGPPTPIPPPPPFGDKSACGQ